MQTITFVRQLVRAAVLVVVAGGVVAPVGAQTPVSEAQNGVAEPAGYTIGVSDALSVVVWREPEASADVIVRPDGMISLPLIGDITAAGMSTDALNTVITTRLRETGFFTEPTVNVVVTQINSLKVFISGEVNTPGEYALLVPTTIVQLVAMANGFTTYAKKSEVIVIRQPAAPGDPPQRLRVNFDEIFDGKNLERNIIYLMPGDTVLVRE